MSETCERDRARDDAPVGAAQVRCCPAGHLYIPTQGQPTVCPLCRIAWLEKVYDGAVLRRRAAQFKLERATTRIQSLEDEILADAARYGMREADASMALEAVCDAAQEILDWQLCPELRGEDGPCRCPSEGRHKLYKTLVAAIKEARAL